MAPTGTNEEEFRHSSTILGKLVTVQVHTELKLRACSRTGSECGERDKREDDTTAARTNSHSIALGSDGWKLRSRQDLDGPPAGSLSAEAGNSSGRKLNVT